MKLTPYEQIGIGVSIFLMALGLYIARAHGLLNEAQTEVSHNITVSDSDNSLEGRLTRAFAGGELSDLVTEDTKVGVGAKVKKGDTVEVNYTGRLQDGTEFDSSYSHGQTFTFTVGEGKVIQGWEEGIIGMQKGGERILVIPPRMAYGNQQMGPIPPNSPLIFKIELVAIK